MFERPNAGERAILVDLDFGLIHEDEGGAREFIELARAAGALPLATITGKRDKPEAKYFLSKGKLEDLKQLVLAQEAELVLFNHELSPAQERNLERELHCRVLSRTGLILDIFAQRARTHEGMLQVELAQLEHLSTRLVRGWTHLERQKGGIGLRGPGETQLETDRRLLRARISAIKDKLKRVRNQREQNRKKRQKADIPTVALVGYTNAGKSELFNKLTKANTLVANQLFATLDPTLRSLELPVVGRCIFADTVGFVSNLPHTLVDAFRATLEETNNATLLLQVVDAHNPYAQKRLEQVNSVLAEIGAQAVEQLIVYNKIDLLEEPWAQTGKIEYDEEGIPQQVWISALTGAGMDKLYKALELRLANLGNISLLGELSLTGLQSALRSKLYDAGCVLKEATQPDEDGWLLTVKMSQVQWDKLLDQMPELDGKLKLYTQ